MLFRRDREDRDIGGSVPDPEFGVGIAGELGMSQRPACGPLRGIGWDWFGDVGWELPVELGAVPDGGLPARVVVTRLGGPAALLTLIFIERFGETSAGGS